MKRKFDFLKEPWGANIIILLLITVALWAAYNLLHTGEEKTMPRVSVIVEDSSNERWTAFRLGIDQAAREYGVDVAFIASPEFESAQDQKNLISQEAAGGADALILSLYDKLSPAEIAQITGGSEDEVISRLRCSKGHIKSELEAREHETGEHFYNTTLVPFDNVYSYLIHSRGMSAESAAKVWEQIQSSLTEENQRSKKRKIPFGIKAAIAASVATIVNFPSLNDDRTPLSVLRVSS